MLLEARAGEDTSRVSKWFQSTGVLIGERFLEPLRRFGSPLIDLMARKSWLEHQSMFDGVAVVTPSFGETGTGNVSTVDRRNRVRSL